MHKVLANRVSCLTVEIQISTQWFAFSGDKLGAGPREAVVPALPAAVRHQAPPLGRHHPPRPEALQHSGQVGLHAQDTGLRAGEAGGRLVHDDAVRRHQVLQVGFFVCCFEEKWTWKSFWSLVKLSC